MYFTTCWSQSRFPPRQSAAHFLWNTLTPTSPRPASPQFSALIFNSRAFAQLCCGLVCSGELLLVCSVWLHLTKVGIRVMLLSSDHVELVYNEVTQCLTCSTEQDELKSDEQKTLVELGLEVRSLLTSSHAELAGPAWTDCPFVPGHPSLSFPFIPPVKFWPCSSGCRCGSSRWGLI